MGGRPGKAPSTGRGRPGGVSKCANHTISHDDTVIYRADCTAEYRHRQARLFVDKQTGWVPKVSDWCVIRSRLRGRSYPVWAASRERDQSMYWIVRTVEGACPGGAQGRHWTKTIGLRQAPKWWAHLEYPQRGCIASLFASEQFTSQKDDGD